MINLANEVIVLTGANGLLGRELTNALLKQGAKVAAIDVNYDGFDLEFKNIAEDRLKKFKTDITNDGELEKCLEQIFNHFKRIDGLINNAAINPKVEGAQIQFVSLNDISYSQWKDELDVGLYGLVNCSRYIAKYMSKNDSGGSIVNIGSDYGHIAPKQHLYEQGMKKPITYSVVKHGVIGATKYLATYFAQDNIRINAVSPGGISNGQDSEFVSRISKEIPLGRMAKVSEISGAVMFLLSKESSYITGQDLIVDGGRSVW